MTFFTMQFRATMLVLLIVLLRSLFLYKLPKKVFLSMWALALLRWLVPYTENLPAGFSFPNLEWRFLSQLYAPQNAAAPSGGVATFTTYTVPWYLLCIWVAGCLALAVFFIVGHIRGRAVYRFAVPVLMEDVLLWAEENKIKRRVRVMQCREVSSALTYGVCRPVILLPSGMETEERKQLHFILSHELEHIRHFDVVWKWISAVALCLYWWNPMIWVLYILMNRDIELHCDECVLKKYGIHKNTKSAYAMTLIALAEKKSRAVPLASHFSKNATEERILSILHGRYAPALFVGTALLGIAVLAFLSFVTFRIGAGPPAYTLPL